MTDHAGSPQVAASGQRIGLDRVIAIVGAARADGRTTLREPEGRDLLEAIGVAVPPAVYVGVDEGSSHAVRSLAGDRVVVRVVADGILHKTEVGGVAVVAREAVAVETAMAAMRRRLGDAVRGWVVAEHVTHDPGIGGSLLLAARWTPDAGVVVTVGAGGIDAESVAADLAPGRAMAILSPALTPRSSIPGLLGTVTAVRLATTSQRGRPPRLAMAALVNVVERFLAVAEAAIPDSLAELEVNPLVVTDGGLVALDVLATLGDGPPPPVADRPRWKLDRLLHPRSAAIVGVSSGSNPGRTILGNLLRDGFSSDAITVVKPGLDAIDGCRCVPDLGSLPAKVDLLVVALSARQSAEAVADAIERDAAETIVLIAGGLEEKQGTGALVGRMHDALAASRLRPDGGPLVNGGNCLGIRSVPGHYDTLFIPGTKLPPPGDVTAPLAIVAQSGAFAITRLSRLADLHPRYLATVGNQMDVTIGDYLEFLGDDASVDVFGVYVEGFRPGDAARFCTATRHVVERGGTVVLYLAGRTEAGTRASASHTASIAGDRVVVRELARQSGAIVVESLDAFDDVVRAATLLQGRPVAGRRVGALSNAGFECVAIGDAAGSLVLDPFPDDTAATLGAILAGVGAGGVVDVHNPLDATPMADDAAFVALSRAILDAPSVDAGIIGIVPLTAELQTLEPGAGHAEDLHAAGGVAAGLAALWRATRKPWVAVVDGGTLYDPFAEALADAGIPVFRTADRAARALEAVISQRLRS